MAIITTADLPISIEKCAIQAQRAQEKSFREFQDFVRTVEPYLDILRNISFREIHNHIQYLNSILPTLSFLRFIEKRKALSRAQSQIRFYWEILSNASYRKEKTFCCRVENSPPTTLDSHVTSSKVTELASVEVLKPKGNDLILRCFSHKSESRFSVVPEGPKKYIEDYKILKGEGRSKAEIFIKLLLKVFLKKLFKFIS